MTQTQTEVQDIRDAIENFCNAVESAIVTLRKDVCGKTPAQTKADPKQEAQGIVWEEKMGPNGPYFRAYANANQGSAGFQGVLEALQKKPKRNMVVDGYFYWIFRDTNDICRKIAKGGRRA